VPTRPPRRATRPPHGGDHHSRTFLDDDGHAWRVTERDAAHIPNARGPRVLLFEAEHAWRLVWTFPADWRAMRDAELVALSLAR